MNSIIAIASVAITAALLFYSLGVFGERGRGRLQRRHVILFWIGLSCDTTGTLLMSAFARASGTGTLGLHAITGAFAIVLMIVHALWATLVFIRGGEQARATFSRFSIVVWLIWLVPYVCGMLIGTPLTHMDGVLAGVIAIAVALGTAIVIWFYDRRGAHLHGDYRIQPRRTL